MSSLLPEVFVILLYASLLGLAYHRWRWRGLLAVAVGATVANVVLGTLSWWPPHVEPAAVASRGQDWLCHSTNFVPSTLLLALGASIALHIGQRRFVTPWARASLAIGGITVALPFAAVLMLYWILGPLACDAI